MSKSNWDMRYLQMAALVATFSKDPSTQVGCVIADDQNRIVSLGYNGFPRGATDDERLHDRAKKYSMIIHAEENAVLNASRNLKGCSAFLTHPPCSHCIGVLSQVGISRVVFEEPSKDFKSRWNFEEILNYLIEVNIEASSYRRV